jgi:hypothetical protein|tara:strand:+ start:566 stop:730 length:165 start_codon:yes stop_codon:yes gene_type:complete
MMDPADQVQVAVTEYLLEGTRKSIAKRAQNDQDEFLLDMERKLEEEIIKLKGSS